MISGLIVYSQTDREKNTWFINKCINVLADKGISLLYKEEKEVLDYVNGHKVDFVIYRARDYHLVETLETKGIRCFNNALTNKTANDKYLTYQFLKKHNIPCLDSFLSFEEVMKTPLIMKSVDGHGGQEVFLVNSKEEADRIANSLKKRMIYQELCNNHEDLRLYVLNKKVVGAVLRNNPSDYRSNYSLGGQVKAYQPEQEIVDIAESIANLLDADFIGVDFIKNKKWCLNEIEDPVGSRMLYQTIQIDIIAQFANYIASCLKK